DLDRAVTRHPPRRARRVDEDRVVERVATDRNLDARCDLERRRKKLVQVKILSRDGVAVLEVGLEERALVAGLETIVVVGDVLDAPLIRQLSNERAVLRAGAEPEQPVVAPEILAPQ